MEKIVKKINAKDYKGMILIEEKEAKGKLVKSELFLSYYNFVQDSIGSMISFNVTKLNTYDDSAIVVLDAGHESYNNDDRHLSGDEIYKMTENLDFRETFVGLVKANDCSLYRVFDAINEAYYEYTGMENKKEAEAKIKALLDK